MVELVGHDRHGPMVFDEREEGAVARLVAEAGEGEVADGVGLVVDDAGEADGAVGGEEPWRLAVADGDEVGLVLWESVAG